jgi:hypothetical protein
MIRQGMLPTRRQFQYTDPALLGGALQWMEPPQVRRARPQL